MSKFVKTFREIIPEEQVQAGGKGGTLARLYQAGYPVPDGFVIMPSAFTGEYIHPDAWRQITSNLETIRKLNGKTAFAVRSSALAEDSAFASFAGEFETVLDVHTDEAVKAAIYQVYHSRKADRVKAYSQAKGLAEEQDIAVVVQKLIRADISGILFTADPVTGNRFTMTGNYTYGFGEELVSGEVEPYTFTLRKPKGAYEGPLDLKRFAKRLYTLAEKLEDELGCPQDIEWAIEGGELYLLQSRPITTLVDYDPATGERNSSYSGDYVWMGSEVFPEVMTPSTYSIFQHFHNFEIGGMKGIGNIGGRMYMNYSLVDVMMKAFGRSQEYTIDYVRLTTGFDLRGVTFPDIPLSRWYIIRSALPVQIKILPMQAKLMKRFDEIISSNPDYCDELRQQIHHTTEKNALVALWHDRVYPRFYDLLMIQDKANENYFFPYLAARKMLVKLMEEAEAEALLVKLVGGSGELTSIRPLLGLVQVARGEMSREEYTRLAGHRLPQEDELTEPRPYEDPDWIDKRIAEYKRSPVDYDGILAQRAAESKRVWDEFSSTYPKQSGKIRRKLDQVADGMEKREIIRSELTRAISVIRSWFLQAGKLTNLGEDLLFLADHEVLDILSGKDTVIEFIPTRRETTAKQISLPKYPLVISGRFDPYKWAKDPDRRSDVFDSHGFIPTAPSSDTLKGRPGSAGRVEGIVHIIYSPKEADQFSTGEILVASSTNVGWTPLFPKAAAVITDVGAPLSHAAIVAREFGIPAVVGVGNATMQLKTGDRVLVDGGKGIVKIITGSSSS
jgi:phosphohistidine swiveling domain-containing protein